MKILVTGAAGFIGSHLSKFLLNRGDLVFGIDNLNDYYDVSLKKSRLNFLKSKHFNFEQVSLEDKLSINKIFENNHFDAVVNLAAQAGVRYSITNPTAYIDSNIVGFLNILEACRHNKIEHLIYASSSSVYGINGAQPFSVSDNVDHPISLYAATKKSNELMAHTYSHLYDLPTTGLRFFTVYGPWGRPDMALFLFTKAILNEEPIQVFNNGKMRRDFTYIDDIVYGLLKVIDTPALPDSEWNNMKPDPATSPAPYRIFNIGNNDPVELNTFIHEIEKATGKKAIKDFQPIQPGDVPATFANIDALYEYTGFKPNTSISKGIESFVNWYKDFYKIQ
jgi:UDP-glucuronate 4-epimerase